MGAVLEVSGVRKEFGGVVALNDVCLVAEPGKITAVIGPNGAGKTTLFNIIAGVFGPTSGVVSLAGKALNGKSTHERTKIGIARTFQQVLLFNNMSVLENVMVGRHVRSHAGILSSAFRLPGFRHEEENIKLQSLRYLNLVGLGGKANESASVIPFGQQRLVAIARALATEPQVLLLDEPGAGLNALEKMELADLIVRIKEDGITVLLVEHDMELVMRVADWVVVLDYGEKIAEGTPSEVQKNKKVIAAYLGEEVE